MDAANYSWGEFYETLKEMKENGDDAKDELFDKMSSYFQELDKASTRETIYNILCSVARFFTLESEAQNRINSKCLDGLLLTRYALSNGELDLWQALAEHHSEYIDTCKFYIAKGMTKHSFYAACEFDRPELLVLLIKNGTYSVSGAHICCLFDSLKCLKLIHAHYPDCLELFAVFRDAIRYGSIEMVKFFLDNTQHDIFHGAFPIAANRGSCELLELFFERAGNSYNLDFALFEACKENRREAVKVLLKHGAQVTNFLLSFDDTFDGGIMEILREEKEQREKDTQVQN